MSAFIKTGGDPVTKKSQLVEDLETGNKPPEDWRIGTEHEKFLYNLGTLKRLPYEGESGVGALLNGMRRFDWDPVLEGDNIIAL